MTKLLEKAFKEVCEELEKGEKVKKHEGISFENLDVMRRYLRKSD